MGEWGLVSPFGFIRTMLAPRVGVVKVEGLWGWKRLPDRKPPPISVPPQYSMTGLYLERAINQCMSSGEEASPEAIEAAPRGNEMEHQVLNQHARSHNNVVDVTMTNMTATLSCLSCC